jgi:hypothetical protein
MYTAGTRLVVHLSPWALLLAVAALGSGSHARGAVTAPAPGRATGGLPPVP